ncbi:MAG: T9SS type A sorting domain-containing protein, partial [Bacteroidia bacterium]
QSLPGKITKISKYEWRGISRDGMNSFKLEGNPVRISGKPATYDFTHTVTSVNGCKTTYTDTLTVPDVYLWVKLPADTSVCINTVMDITAERHNGKGDVNYMWSTDYGNWVKNKNKISINITQDTVILVYVQDSLKCFDIDTIRIKAQKPPKPELGPDRRECSIAGQFIELSNLDTLIKPKSVQWFKTNGSTGGNTPLSTSAKLHVKDSGKYWVLITDSVGCTGTDSINILFNPTIDVERKTIKACHGDSVTLVGGTTSVNAAWKWEDIRYMHLGLPPVSTQQNYKLLAVSNGQIFTLKYKVTVTQNINGLLCKDIDTISLVIYPLPAVKAGKLVPQCADNDTYNLNQAINSPSGGRWTYSKNRNDLIMANVVSPKNLGPGNHYLYYWYNDSITNCQGYDSTLLVIDSLPEVNAGKDTLLCNTNTIISFSGTPVGGSWTMLDPNTKGFSSSPNASFDASKSGTGKFGFIYSYQDTASARCSNQDTIYVTIYTSLIAKGGQYPVQCNSANDLELVGNPVKGTWNTNLTGVLSQDTAGKYHFSPAKAGVGNHKLWYTVSHPQGACPKTDTIYIQVDSNCVWPGDANLDKTADYLDILDIALGYSASGSPRINASTDWIPQLSKDWSNSLSSGINYKHLDTNGDSMIDATDTFAIAKNYGKTHLKNEEPQLAGNPNDPPLYFQFNKKYYLAGDTVKAALYVGSADKPVNNIYGLGLKHFFANPYMVNETYNFSWNCEMLCGAKDNFQLYRQFNDKGTGEGSMIRTDKLTTSKPFGKVADVEFILKDSTFSYPSGGTNISIDILKSRLIDMNRNEIPVYTKSDAVKVYRTQNEVVGIKENHNLKSEINIYPNPANNLVYIDGGEQRFNEITMANLLGETVAFSNLQTSKTSINIAHLSAGIYFIRVRSGNQFSQHKLVITR